MKVNSDDCLLGLSDVSLNSHVNLTNSPLSCAKNSQVNLDLYLKEIWSWPTRWYFSRKAIIFSPTRHFPPWWARRCSLIHECIRLCSQVKEESNRIFFTLTPICEHEISMMGINQKTMLLWSQMILMTIFHCRGRKVF